MGVKERETEGNAKEKGFLDDEGSLGDSLKQSLELATFRGRSGEF